MKILFIAPLPPPIHGQALASEVFLKEIQTKHDVILINAAKKKPKNILGKLTRNFEVAGILAKIIRHHAKADLIYLTISESILGNFKDILTYLICFKKLDKMTIHLHGGAGMFKIMKRNSWLAGINAFFIKRLQNVIVLGESLKPIFNGIVPATRLHIVPNFAEDDLFVDEKQIQWKFRPDAHLNVLFLSNLLPGKGYLELLDAYITLSDELKSEIRLNFAGAFGSKDLERQFFDRIKGLDTIQYHGVVGGSEKKLLFSASQIFCLPTYYPFEGQPISILEAYASGCIVITTNHSGIQDVFTNVINGFEVEKRSPESIKHALENISKLKRQSLVGIGKFNREIAHSKFRTSIYNSSLKRIIEI